MSVFERSAKYIQKQAVPRRKPVSREPRPSKPALPVQEIEFSSVLANPGSLHDVLKKDGVVIVNGVLSEREIETGVDLFWKAMGQMCPRVKRDVLASWRNQYWSRNYTTGVVQEEGMSGSEYMWFARTRPHVVKCFEILHDTQDLIVSLDTTRATRGQNSGTTSKLHVDQHAKGQFRHYMAFQGGINFTDSGPVQAGFGAVVGSHTQEYEDLFLSKTIAEQKGNTFVIPDDHEMQERCVKPNIKVGSLTIWNFRVAHRIMPSPEKTDTPKAACITLTAFVSYFPRTAQIRKDFALRRSSAESGAPNNHWAIAAIGGTVPTWPRATGSRYLQRIPSFYPSHKEELEKWI